MDRWNEGVVLKSAAHVPAFETKDQSLTQVGACLRGSTALRSQ